MSTGFMFHGGFDEWADWTTGDRVWLLMGAGFVADIAQATIAEIVADELAVAGYARQPLTDAVRADTYTYVHGLAYGAHPPVFTGLSPGEVFTGLVLARVGATDADSPLIAWWEWYDPTDIGDAAFGFSPWEDGSGSPLPGGDADTRLIHQHDSWGTA